MSIVAGIRRAILTALVAAVGAAGWALEPPTSEQLARYRADGSLAWRVAAAKSLGNHRVAPQLAARSDRLPADPKLAVVAGLASMGTQRVLALLIAFSDYPAANDAAEVDDALFSDGAPDLFPYESLAAFYRRSSYGLLEIEGATLGWYTTPYPRSQVAQNTPGREALIREAVAHFDDAGHDFSQYDNDGDGAIDYFVVIWTGPHQDWAEFWWGYQTRFQDQSFVVDGTRLGVYSWQWESYDYPGPFAPYVVIHETGHALGLPDYYDYDESVGPSGGVGGLDMMDGNWGDHNCFSKYLLGWLEPQASNEGTVQLLLSPTGEAPEAALLMHGNPRSDPFGEYFMVQHRRRQANDATYPTDGLLIWHVDARPGPGGGFLYDNSYTDHKLLRLMEADGLEQIERDLSADAGDFYTAGDVFGTDTLPSSHRYDGTPTKLLVDSIGSVGDRMALRADLGSGCALFCDATVGRTAWPRVPLSFTGDLGDENCDGVPLAAWHIAGVDFPGEDEVGLALPPGSHPWSFTGDLGDAECTAQGELLVCPDERCRQWRTEEPMTSERMLHAAVLLRDGRVLVAGGGGGPELFDPASRSWIATGELEGGFAMASGALLGDGRVLLTGSTPDDPVNAAVYDPETDLWTATGQMVHDRTSHGSVALADGRVLVAGGFVIDGDDAAPVLATEVFDPATETWSEVGDLPEPMELPELSRLTDGRVLLTANRKAIFFDPATDTWSAPHQLAFPRVYHAALPLSDGRVLLLGGLDTALVTVFDPEIARESLVGSMGTYRILPGVALLPSGSVLVTGGIDASFLVNTGVELLDPVAREWAEAAGMADARFAHELTVLPGGSVLATGGASLSSSGAFVPFGSVESFVQPPVPPLPVEGRLSP